ncbi:MAG: hypothetical protein NVS4B8_00030 [Herpetosiphon sp.]
MTRYSWTRLVLIRHGETAPNREFRYIGGNDSPLTETGELQAVAVESALQTLPVQAIYCSPRKRTISTAMPLSKRLCLPLNIDQALAEGSFGTWEGLTRDEVIARGVQDSELHSHWETDASIAPPGGESFQMIQSRVVDFATMLVHNYPSKTLAVISHVGPIKALVAATLGAPLAATRRMFLDLATITVVDWGEKPVLRLFNSHAHLGWQHARWMTAE